ncbi:methyltransferase domain-containing protein [Pseudomonas sp. UBA4194]|uniref:methyltransferase domain-containing protein n=1 Tax=Pseudomonas sp. UBA4194 TaxID=1947317 RepID=UPI0025D902BC|nr:methyltransferase domain-containing protein [Pseudomonas sp. UBA4194]
MSATFYRAFEDRHRGTRELISQRQQVYLPFIQPLLELADECAAVDLGCGRGEWLEILITCGFNAQGIDLDSGMLEACKERGLPAWESDALAFLATLEDDSQSVVSGFHIAEHVPFPDLQTMVAEALRVLKPGGILILETPNAENLVVGTNSFYLDPTHERPIPHLLLSFLTEHTGFLRSKLMRLQEPAQLHEPDFKIDLMAVFSGVSPDYAIVAQKGADREILQKFDEAYEKTYGLSLDELATRYDSVLTGSISELRMQVERQGEQGASLEGQLTQVKHRSFALEARTLQIEAIADQLRHQLQDSAIRAIRAEARTQEMELTLRESHRHTAHAEARQAATEASNDVLRQQIHQMTQEFFEQRKELQRLEVKLEFETDLKCAGENSSAEASLASESAPVVGSSLSAEDEAKLLQYEALLSDLELARNEIRQSAQEREELRAHVDQQGSAVDHLQLQLNDSLGNAHHWYQQAMAYESQFKRVTGSFSWRITRPMRVVARGALRIVKSPLGACKSIVRRLAGRGVRFVISRPRLAARLNGLLKKSPRLHARLSRFARPGHQSPVAPGPAVIVHNGLKQPLNTSVSHRANAIYQALENSNESKVRH